MRTYKIDYYVESNDECQERQIEIKARNMLLAFAEFRSEVRVFKRIFKIEEKAENEKTENHE